MKPSLSFSTLITITLGMLGTSMFGYVLFAAAATKPPVDSYFVEFNLSDISPGGRRTFDLNGKPIFVWHRLPDDIKDARSMKQPEHISHEWSPDTMRTYPGKSQWLVLEGYCYYDWFIAQGQRVYDNRGEFGGWYCVHSTAHFDKSGRVVKNDFGGNGHLKVPPYVFVNDATIGFVSNNANVVSKSWKQLRTDVDALR